MSSLDDVTHVSHQYDVRLYLDGKLQQTVAETSGKHQRSRFPLMMGSDPDDKGRPQRFFHGVIHQLRVSAIPRYTVDFEPEKQLQADKHTEALYRMQEDTGSELKDLSGHEHHGTIHDAVWWRPSQ